jgi:hypothetical protein
MISIYRKKQCYLLYSFTKQANAHHYLGKLNNLLQ